MTPIIQDDLRAAISRIGRPAPSPSLATGGTIGGMRYNEYRYYSPILDAEAARLSIVNRHGDEYFAVVPCGDEGKVWRERREGVLSKVYAAMLSGHAPGEVMITHASWSGIPFP